MKVDIVSDLHVEFNDFKFEKLLENTESSKIIIAGDLGLIKSHNTQEALKWLCRRYEEVIYVPGNHDYYDYSIAKGTILFTKLEETFPNFTLLSPNKTTTLGKYKVIGDTLWVPYSHYLRKYPINDALLISDIYDHIGQLNTRAREFFQKEVDENTILVTHHLPHAKCITPKFAGDPYNCWFYSDECYLIESRQPKAVIYGHTHDRADFMIGKTRMINNAYGYPKEFQPFKTITFDID